MVENVEKEFRCKAADEPSKGSKYKASKFKKLKACILGMLFPIITFLVLSPLEIYAGNQSEFIFGTSSFIWLFLAIGTLAMIIGVLILMIIPEKISRLLRLFIFACTFTAYIQNMFLNKTLMKTDGSRIKWEEYASYTKIDTIVWVLIIVLLMLIPLYFKKNWEKTIIYGNIIMSLIQFIAAGSLILTLPYKMSNDKIVALSGEDEMALSPNNNIIVLVLDRYSNIIFENGPDADPDFYNTFSDFTYYNNANSSYNYTFPSMPFMMTQVKPDCTITTKEYKENVWSEGVSKKFHEVLADKGYRYNFFTQSGRHVFLDAAYLEGSVDNIVKVPANGINISGKTIIQLFSKMTVYKYAPYVVKPYAEVSNLEFDGIVSYKNVPLCYEGNSGYYEALLSDGLYIDDSYENAFILQQLSGIHTPYTMAADGSTCEDNDDRLTDCQLGINVMLEEYFSQLKKLGLYDKATIIITADHGLHFDQYSPQPIFLIKEANETHDEMQINSAPISTEDFLATIVEIIDKYEDINNEKNDEADKDNKSSEFGTSIWDWKEGDKRTRYSAFPNNGFDVYTYEGDCSDLIERMKNGDSTRIEATEDWD